MEVSSGALIPVSSSLCPVYGGKGLPDCIVPMSQGAVSPSQGAGSSSAAKNGPAVQFGITNPISLQEPSETDWKLTERLLEELDREFPKESSQGMEHRYKVLEELDQALVNWVNEESKAQMMSPEECKKWPVKTVTIGSFRLGVVHPLTDIDTLCIIPKHITLPTFFKSFVEKLKGMPSVTECVPIPEAFTPIVKLKMNGVLFDLLIARLAHPLPPEAKDLEKWLLQDEVFRDMDETSVRCIHGYRVAVQIPKLVPNVEHFLLTTRFIKFWARRRGIYSNIMGFFGGITWTLMVARVCQLFPHYAPSQLVNRFFRVYDQWNWSKPVCLCETVEQPSSPGIVGLKVWNPKANFADKNHVMPVITPAFPAMNTTHNVTETTKQILLDEIRRGYEVVKRVESNTAEWAEVHEPLPFFSKFPHFLWLEILAKTEEVYQKFSGWVESKLRVLTKQLVERGMSIHPNPEQYIVHLADKDAEWKLGCGMFIAMAFFKDLGASVGQCIDLREAPTKFVEVINEWPEKSTYDGQYLLRLKRVRQKELPEYALQAEAAKKRPRASRTEA